MITSIAGRTNVSAPKTMRHTRVESTPMSSGSLLFLLYQSSMNMTRKRAVMANSMPWELNLTVAARIEPSAAPRIQYRWSRSVMEKTKSSSLTSFGTSVVHTSEYVSSDIPKMVYQRFLPNLLYLPTRDRP